MQRSSGEGGINGNNNNILPVTRRKRQKSDRLPQMNSKRVRIWLSRPVVWITLVTFITISLISVSRIQKIQGLGNAGGCERARDIPCTSQIRERNGKNLSTVDGDSDWEKNEVFVGGELTNLIVVAGHAIFIGPNFRELDSTSGWVLEEYQKAPGMINTFIDHIRIGVEAAAGDPESMLLFSGGETRKSAGPRTEGQSYWEIADHHSWFGHLKVRERAYAEVQARDSYENLLFSLCRFRQLSGHYPRLITVIGYRFKEFRFTELHRAALQFPHERFKYIGNEVPVSQVEKAIFGENKTVSLFQKDPYSCFGLLRDKRLFRDPFKVGLPSESTCPEMRTLLRWCGPHQFNGYVPWDR